MDDTILDYEAVGERCWRDTCRMFAPQVPGLDPGRLQDAINQALVWYWGKPERNRLGRLNLVSARREIVARAFRNVGVCAPGVSVQIADYFTEHRETAVEAIPGAIETEERLRDDGVKLALITNGASLPQRAKIDRFGLEPLFDYIMVEGEFGAGKPDPRVYVHSLAQLEVSPQEAWMVGDNLEFAVAGPKLLGVTGSWVDWKDSGLPQDSPVQPDRIIQTISELVETS